jgi:hypothetical protein
MSKRCTVDEIENGFVAPKLQNEATPGAFSLLILEAARSTQDGGDRRKRRDGLWQLSGYEARLAIFLQILFCTGDERDHTLIGFPRVFPERKDAMLQQNERLDVRFGLVYGSCLLREGKSRHDILHDPDVAIVDLGTDGFCLGLINQAEDRFGMGVIDEFVGKKGMQQGLDRSRGSHRVE